MKTRLGSVHPHFLLRRSKAGSMVFHVDWWTVPNEHANHIVSNSHSAVDMSQSASCVEKAGCVP